MDNVNRSPTTYTNGYDLSSPTEITPKATTRNNNQYQSNVSIMDTATETTTTTRNNLPAYSSNHHNNNPNPTHENIIKE